MEEESKEHSLNVFTSVEEFSRSAKFLEGIYAGKF
jgi:hypothetical protein